MTTPEIQRPSATSRVVRCPTCRGDSVFAPSNVSRPFCSPRCKNMDLGAWANEEFRVNSTTMTSDDDVDKEDLN